MTSIFCAFRKPVKKYYECWKPRLPALFDSGFESAYKTAPVDEDWGMICWPNLRDKLADFLADMLGILAECWKLSWLIWEPWLVEWVAVGRLTSLAFDPASDESLTAEASFSLFSIISFEEETCCWYFWSIVTRSFKRSSGTPVGRLWWEIRIGTKKRSCWRAQLSQES